jgi:hypothetical protein
MMSKIKSYAAGLAAVFTLVLGWSICLTVALLGIILKSIGSTARLYGYSRDIAPRRPAWLTSMLWKRKGGEPPEWRYGKR